MLIMDVIGIGALNADLILRTNEIIKDGESQIKEIATVPGGSAANTIYGLAKLGLKTGFIGIVGKDQNGKMLLDSYRKVGTDIGHIKSTKMAKTGCVLCLSDLLGNRSMYIYPGANKLLSLVESDYNYAAGTTILHLSSFANPQQFQLQLILLDKVKNDVKVSFSPGMLYATTGLEHLKTIFSRTHILFLNKDEIEVMTGKSFAKGAAECQRAGCEIVVVTFGRGIVHHNNRICCYIRTGDSEYYIKTAPLIGSKNLETTGAGDAFMTGFLFSYFVKANLENCGRAGDTMARFAIAKTGARKGFPSLEQLKAKYTSDWKTELC